MWELPRIDASAPSAKPILHLRHAIMQTNYRVSVIEVSSPKDLPACATCSWVKLGEASALPLTGLAKKILLRLGLLHRSPANPAQRNKQNLPPAE
jgi:hypothetical protein